MTTQTEVKTELDRYCFNAAVARARQLSDYDDAISYAASMIANQCIGGVIDYDRAARECFRVFLCYLEGQEYRAQRANGGNHGENHE